MTAAALFLLIFVTILAVRRLSLIGLKLVASLADLTQAIADNTTAVNALTAAAGTIQPPHDFQPEVDAINANTTAVNAVTAQLTGP